MLFSLVTGWSSYFKTPSNLEIHPNYKMRILQQNVSNPYCYFCRMVVLVWMELTNTLANVHQNIVENFAKLNPWLPIWTLLVPIMIVNMEFVFNHLDEMITFVNVLPDIQV